MTGRPLRLAVVGHTNTGKTSLLRTLTRDVTFGEVSPRPAVTRHVEGTAMLVEGELLAELYDTPGLEDSIGLLDHLDTQPSGRREDRHAVIQRFLESDAARTRFAQEAKALRQVCASDVALYVIDARDAVLGKHHDELEILSRCGRPIVPVLNFIAGTEVRTGTWREHLSRVGLHAVAEFDTVVFDAEGEIRLFEKIRTLLDEHRPALDRLIEDRRRQRALLERASSQVVADLLLDAAACVVPVAVDDADAANAAVEMLRRRLRGREQECVEQLLRLHQFSPEDCAADVLPLSEGRWGLDLFSPEALRSFGVRTGTAAAAGAVAGLAVDAMVAGLSLGAAAATGAAIGALWSTGQSHGRRLVDRLRGVTELRCDDATIRLLAVRQIVLVRALLRRGHAAQQRLALDRTTPTGPGLGTAVRLPVNLRRARTQPGWSRLNASASPGDVTTGRDAAETELSRRIEAVVTAPPDTTVQFP